MKIQFLQLTAVFHSDNATAPPSGHTAISHSQATVSCHKILALRSTMWVPPSGRLAQ